MYSGVPGYQTWLIGQYSGGNIPYVPILFCFYDLLLWFYNTLFSGPSSLPSFGSLVSSLTHQPPAGHRNKAG